MMGANSLKHVTSKRTIFQHIESQSLLPEEKTIYEKRKNRAI